MFPEGFEKYEPFNIGVIAEKTDLLQNSKLITTDVDNLSAEPAIAYSGLDLLNEYPKEDEVAFIGYQDFGPELKAALEENRIEIAPAAHTVDLLKLEQVGGQKLPANLAATLQEYHYYNVEMGLNIILGQGYKITELHFMSEIFGDGNASTDTIAYDIFPDDQVKRVSIISGEISLGINELFQSCCRVCGFPDPEFV